MAVKKQKLVRVEERVLSGEEYDKAKAKDRVSHRGGIVREEKAASRGFGKGRTAYSRKLYDLLVEAYRERPGEHSYASRVAGCVRSTAARAWNQGWVPRISWAKAIREVLEDERAEARALVAKKHLSEAEEAAEIRERMRREAIEAHAAEGQMVRLARSDATSLLAAVGKLQPALHKLSERLGVMLMDDGEKMSRREAAALLSTLSRTTKEALAAGQVAIELERLHLGAPTQILGVQDVGEMSTGEAVKEIEAAAAALNRAKTLGLISGINEINVSPEKDEAWDDYSEDVE